MHIISLTHEASLHDLDNIRQQILHIKSNEPVRKFLKLIVVTLLTLKTKDIPIVIVGTKMDLVSVLWSSKSFLLLFLTPALVY